MALQVLRGKLQLTNGYYLEESDKEGTWDRFRQDRDPEAIRSHGHQSLSQSLCKPLSWCMI